MVSEKRFRLSSRKAYEALVYAADNGALVASCSFSSASLSASYKAAIDYFIDNAGVALDGSQRGAMRVGVVICAAGNDGSETRRYPAAYERCIAVAYITPDLVISPSSNYGDWIDVVAPGGSLLAAFGAGQQGGVYSTLPVGSPNGAVDGYGYKAGSSMAAPHVAGIAALVVSRFGTRGPGFTAAMLETRLREGTRPLEEYNAAKYRGKTGTGLVDAFLALKSDEGIPPGAPGELTAAWRTNSADLRWIVPGDQNGLPAVGFELFWSRSPLDGLDPGSPAE